MNSDGNIRYFEYAQDKFEFLSEYKSADPQRGVAFLPKRGINTHENEVMRAFKTVNDSYIEPISFIVPRRAEVFQDDIYPPVVGIKPAMSSREWFEGKEGLPPKIDLASVYAGEEPAEIPSESKPSTNLFSSTKPPSPTKKTAESANEPLPPSAALRSPPPSMKEQTSSIAQLASKFTDKEDEAESDEDSSSFEEVPKPVDRSERNISWAKEPVEATTIPRGLVSEPIQSEPKRDIPESTSSVLSSQPIQTKTEVLFPSLSLKFLPFTKIDSSCQPLPTQKSNTTTATTTNPTKPHSPPDSGPIQSYFQEIKSLLEQQSQTMSTQSAKIAQLTAEVDTLKTALSSRRNSKDAPSLSEREKDARIAILEEQLANLR